MLLSALRPKQKELFGAASPCCGLEGNEWHGTWKGSLRNEHTIMALLWDLHPPIWISQGLSQQRPSDEAAMAGWAQHWASTTGSLESSDLAPPASQTPSKAVMASGGEPRPQSHHSEGLSCKSEHTFRIKFGRCCNSWTLPSAWQTGPIWQITPRVPHCGHGTDSQIPLGGKGEKTTLVLKGLCLDSRLSLSNWGWSQQLQGHTGAVTTLSQQDPARQGALSQRAG